jgi:acetyltransferase-like isoleucine patch superfamily enzyme
MYLRILPKFFKEFLSKTKRSLALLNYDNFTIEEYFRKQGAEIGKNNRIMIRNLGESPSLVTIGNHCTITTDVVLITHDGATWIFNEGLPALQKFGPIRILDNCFIGIRAVIMPNVTIGPNSIVGACSVVTKDVPPNTVVAGNQARVICTVEEYREKVLNIWEKQKPPGYLRDLQQGVKYSPQYIEKRKSAELPLLTEHLCRLFREKKLP